MKNFKLDLTYNELALRIKTFLIEEGEISNEDLILLHSEDEIEYFHSYLSHIEKIKFESFHHVVDLFHGVVIHHYSASKEYVETNVLKVFEYAGDLYVPLEPFNLKYSRQVFEKVLLDLLKENEGVSNV